jgi:hypothetical protein
VIRVLLPAHLKALAKVHGEVHVDVAEPVTPASVLDAIEELYPVLRGTIRDQASGTRRSFVRYFACQEDISHDPVDAPLPDAVVRGQEPFLVIGAMAGG